jgi:23S rRNA (uracil1939-C5)-methyltransferase
VELDRDAVAHAMTRLASLGPFDAPPRLVRGRVEEEAARLSAPAVVITNPPRTGMDRGATQAVMGSGARRVVYISCDPATLARDLSRLAGRYRLVELRSFDQFPNTAHVESVAALEAV